MSLWGQGGLFCIGKLDGVLTAPSRDPSHPGTVPVVRELRAASWWKSSLLQPRGPMPGGHCPRWELSHCSSVLQELTASRALGGLLSPRPGRPPPSLSRHSQPGVLWWEQKGPGVPSWWEPLPLPELSASSPACPAVWPCFSSRLLPVLPLTDIVSVGIYISLTTLSPNGIKSKAGDK